jgi:hypothetical protein
VAGAPSITVGSNSGGGDAHVHAVGAASDYKLTSSIPDPTGGNATGPEYFGAPSAETADGAVGIIGAPATVKDGHQASGAAYIFDAAPMAITGFSPTSGTPGATVTISGKNLFEVTGVTFHGKPAKIVSVKATSVKAVVPKGATSGPIRVTNAEGLSTRSGSSFTVT